METTAPLRGAIEVAAAAALDRGHRIGRFFVLARLGRGGMGEVYAAYDPELDRKVAIKLLQPRISRADAEHAFLLREAQATAKLQHPNVVVIYDVGTHDERVFIAMELIDGQTLRAWMRSGRASWREVLRIFTAAGRGLAAAHAAGLVHRDFKPDNVMITRDGQVRVMDFGLARPVDVAAVGPAVVEVPAPGAALEAARSLAPAGDDTPVAIPYLAANLTETGAQVGTPAYMALEQLIPGMHLDGRTDQFAFCVALYEALYGERPFGEGDLGERMMRVGAGKIAPAPPGSRVPSWLRRVVLRGLAANRDDRFASMSELLAALGDDPAVRRRRWLVGGAVVALVLIGALAAHRAGQRAGHDVCSDGAARLAQVWEAGSAASPRKEQIHRTFLATGMPFAETAFASATHLLDEYAARWVGSYADACEATRVRGEQPAEVLELRMSCLGDRSDNLRALTDVFARADALTVEHAVSAAAALPSLEQCADVHSLQSVTRTPSDPAKRRRIAEAREELARFLAVRDSGQCEQAIALSEPLVVDVEATQYDPLRAEALLAAGEMGATCSDSTVAVRRLKAAFAAAIAGRNDAKAVEAAGTLTNLEIRAGDVERARDWLELGRAALKRLGDEERYEESWLLFGEALVRNATGDTAGAIASAQRSLEMKRRILGPEHPSAMAAFSNLGVILQDAGRFEEAYEVYRRARDLISTTWGPRHPDALAATNNCGEALNALGRYAEARALFEEVVAAWREMRVAPSFLAYGLTGLGRALVGEGRRGEAVGPLEEALKIRVAPASNPKLLGETRFALARALGSRPTEHRRALALARAARADSASDAKAVAEIDAWLAAAGTPL